MQSILGESHIMKKLIRRLFSIVALAPIVAGGSAVAMTNDSHLPVDMEWEQTAKLDTTEAYTEFALNNPTSEYVKEARARLCTDVYLVVAAGPDKILRIDAEEPCSTPKFLPNSIMII